jgi:Ca-activated chloride channel family protein
MTFLWPSMLLTLLVIPVIVALYLRLQWRRRVLATSFYSQGSGQPAKKPAPGFRRHLPPLFSLASLAVILVALARPQAEISLPRVEGTVILVFDVSASMGATDAELPGSSGTIGTRLEAAKMAAREFVLGMPETVQIGIVSFSGSGFAVQMPTNDTNALLNTIDRMQPTSGTSLGQGILAALNTIAVDAGLTTDESATGANPVAAEPAEQDAQASGPPQEEMEVQLPEGTYPSSVIVLLTDGENNQSIDPLKAAQVAAEHGVRIDALGFGTTAGTTLEVDGFSVHTALDEATLQQITGAAGGTYYPAQGDQDAKEVYASLTPELVVKTEAMEITSVLAGASILILLVGSLFSTLWFSRLL